MASILRTFSSALIVWTSMYFLQKFNENLILANNKPIFDLFRLANTWLNNDAICGCIKTSLGPDDLKMFHPSVYKFGFSLLNNRFQRILGKITPILQNIINIKRPDTRNTNHVTWTNCLPKIWDREAWKHVPDKFNICSLYVSSDLHKIVSCVSSYCIYDSKLKRIDVCKWSSSTNCLPTNLNLNW